MVRIVLALVLLAAACSRAPDLTPVPGQGLFTVVVWNDAFGRKDKAPAIEWRRDLVRCPAGHVGYWTGDDCVQGNWVKGDSFVTVADLPDFHDRGQMVVHEYLHVLLERAGRDDPGHCQPEWQAGGLFDLANAKLAAAGW